MEKMKSLIGRAQVRRKEVVILTSCAISRTQIILLIFLLMYTLYSLRGIINENKHAARYPAPKRKTTKLLKSLDFLTSCGMPVQNDPIIKVSDLKAYLISSYIEHRQDVKMIKTLSIVLRNQNAQYHCLMCCNGTDFSVPASYTIHSDHFGYDYGTTDITCEIPENCISPTHVAITSHPTKLNGSLHNVIFQPVRNQHTQNEFPFHFTVCISALYEYSNVLQLIQAMEIFRILGIQRVAIYKTSCDPVVQKVLDYYVKQNFVDLIPWNISSYIKVSRGWKKWESPGELHYFGQIAVLNDCVYRYMYQSRYVALQDMDELIIPMKVKTWTELLPELEKQYGLKAAYIFENNVFPITINDTEQISPDSWNKVKGNDILKHTNRVSNKGREHENYKIIINPRLVYMATVHGLLMPTNNDAWVDSKIAKMYHVKNAPSDFVSAHSIIRDTRIRDFADRLIPAVSEVLQQVLDTH